MCCVEPFKCFPTAINDHETLYLPLETKTLQLHLRLYYLCISNQCGLPLLLQFYKNTGLCSRLKVLSSKLTDNYLNFGVEKSVTPAEENVLNCQETRCRPILHSEVAVMLCGLSVYDRAAVHYMLV